jgi:hypothetical protein
MTTKQSLYLALVVTFIATFAMSLVQTAGVMPTLIVCGSMVGGAVGWYFTSLKYPTDPRKLLPVYLLTVPLLYLHIWEEYLYKFGPLIGALTGTGWTESEFLVQFAFYLPAFWILSAIGLYYRHPLANFIAWFIFFGMFLGEPVHLLVFPNLEGGRYHYFPGMWAALLPTVMGVWGIYVIVKEYKNIKVVKDPIIVQEQKNIKMAGDTL